MRGRRFSEETPVARSVRRAEYRRLPLESINTAVHVRNSEENGCVVDEIARGKIVGAVEDQVVSPRDFERVPGSEARGIRLDVYAGIDVAKSVARGIELRATDARRAVEYLSLQIGEIDRIEIDEADRPDSGSGQIERGGRAKATGTDEEHPRALQRALPGFPNLWEQNVAAITN